MVFLGCFESLKRYFIALSLSHTHTNTHTHTESPSLEQGVGMPPLIANELKEIKLTQLELKVQKSLQLQEIKSSLQSLERTVMNLSEKSKKRSASDVIDVDSLLSSFCSNPPSKSSSTSAFLPLAFGSPPAFGSLPFFRLHLVPICTQRSPHYLANR